MLASFGSLAARSARPACAAASKRTVFTLPVLDYEIAKGLAPVITPQALDLHYNKHHAAYIGNANRLVQGTKFENKDLVTVIRESYGDNVPIFNNTAQIWNHSFFWKCMTPRDSAVEPPAELKKQLEQHFGSVENFRTKFSDHAKALFGSGWTWLVDNDGHLEIINTSNANTPLTSGPKVKPLLTLDIWEHSYYVDHQNRRPEYIEKWWECVNWEFVNKQLEESRRK
jgi:Fe-Mn family superoxide dismutase